MTWRSGSGTVSSMNRFIWRTHLLVALLLTAMSSAGGIATWGVTGPWWDSSLVPTGAGLLVGWTLLFAFPTSWLEAWSLATGHPIAARVIVLAYLVPTWYVTHFLAGFRVMGDTSPIDGSLLMFGWVTFGLLVVAQAATAAWMRIWPFPSAHRARGQRLVRHGHRLSRRLGLIE
jgi:hypothetical protein